MSLTPPNIQNLAKRLQALEESHKELKSKFQALSAMFGWFYIDEKVRDFAIVMRTHQDGTADLLCVGGSVSGGIHVRLHKQLVVNTGGWPKKGRWEPIIYPDLGEMKSLFGSLAEKSEETDEAEQETEVATAKSAIKARS